MPVDLEPHKEVDPRTGRLRLVLPGASAAPFGPPPPPALRLAGDFEPAPAMPPSARPAPEEAIAKGLGLAPPPSSPTVRAGAPPAGRVTVAAEPSPFAPSAAAPNAAPQLALPGTPIADLYLEMARRRPPSPPSPGGWKLGISPEAADTIFGAKMKQEAWEQEAASIAADQSRVEAEEMAVRNAALAAHDATTARAQDQWRDALEARTRDLDTRIRAMRDDKIDPARFYGNLSTGGKIAASISIALGAFSAALTGGRNPGMDLLMSAIDRDIRAQEQNMAHAREGATQEINVLHSFERQFGDRVAARAATRVALLDRASLSLQKIAQDFKGPRQLAAAEGLAAQLQEERGKALAQFQRYVAPSGGGEGGLTFRDLERVAQLRAAETGTAKAGAEAVEALAKAAGGGAEGAAQKEISRRVMAKELSDALIPQILDSVNEARAAVARHGGAGLGVIGSHVPTSIIPDAGREVRQKASLAANKFMQSGSGKTLSDSEHTLMVKVTEGAGSVKEVLRGLDIIERVTRRQAAVLTSPNPTAELPPSLRPVK